MLAWLLNLGFGASGTVEINAYHSLISPIDTDGYGIESTMTSAGIGLLSTMTATFGVGCMMNSRGKGIASTINTAVVSLESGI